MGGAGPEKRLIIVRRFFLGNPVAADEILTVTGAEAHHLKNVLRLKPGTRVVFFDGKGLEYEAELVSLTPEGR